MIDDVCAFAGMAVADMPSAAFAWERPPESWILANIYAQAAFAKRELLEETGYVVAKWQFAAFGCLPWDIAQSGADLFFRAICTIAGMRVSQMSGAYRQTTAAGKHHGAVFINAAHPYARDYARHKHFGNKESVKCQSRRIAKAACGDWRQRQTPAGSPTNAAAMAYRNCHSSKSVLSSIIGAMMTARPDDGQLRRGSYAIGAPRTLSFCINIAPAKTRLCTLRSVKWQFCI